MTDWLPLLLKLLNVIETMTGTQLPRFEGGKLLMPESESAKVALSQLPPADVANTLLHAACKADPTLHSALVVAALNCQAPDKARLVDALKGI